LARVSDVVAKGDELSPVRDQLIKEGFDPADIDTHVHREEKRQSDIAGISVAYLVSDEFTQEAKKRSGLDDPNFYNLEKAFFHKETGIGCKTACPRDRRPGCALVDVVPRRYRRRCTDFLSWIWGYKVAMFQQTLSLYMSSSGREAAETFLYCCFFINNQYRILGDLGGVGSKDLDKVFEAKLRACEQVIAMLDTWNMPPYLTRIWTIFEQFTAHKLKMKVTLIFPKDAADELKNIMRGKGGSLQDVQKALQTIDSEKAKASNSDDLVKVQNAIKKSKEGFTGVNKAVGESMLDWVLEETKKFLMGTAID